MILFTNVVHHPNNQQQMFTKITMENTNKRTAAMETNRPVMCYVFNNLHGLKWCIIFKCGKI